MAPLLPAGWSEQVDEAGTPFYISPDGQSQWEHPSSDSSALPSNDPPTVDEPLLPNPSHNPKRRQYAAAQAAYLSSNTNGPGGTFDSSSAAPVGDLAGSTFVPAYGGAAAAGAAPGYGYGDVKSAAGPGGDSGLAGQFGSMGLGGQKPAAGGFEGDLRYPYELVNLVGMQPDVPHLEDPPPAIRLPSNASVTSSPDAIADYSYMRSTLNAVPSTNSLLKSSKLPLGLVITPYRSLEEGDPEVPVIRDMVIARCRRCRAYIHPYVTFIEGGNRWKCTLCNLSNEVPQRFDWDQETNKPADRWQRAELNHSVVDFVAPSEYLVRSPAPPCYVFVIDVSETAVQTGMVATAARTILESLDRLPNEDGRTKVAIIAVDVALHFFSLPPGANDPTELVVSDLDDVFLPRPDDLLVSLVESRPALDKLLGSLSNLFKDTFTVGNALGAGLKAAYLLIGPIGGKIIVLNSSLPSVGPGALKNREDPTILGTSKESALLAAAIPFYKLLAIDCSKSQVAVDMFLLNSGYADVATLSALPKYTAGQTYFYPSFSATHTEDATKFAYELGDVLSHKIGLEAIIRVRASRGLRMKTFHGNFFIRSTDLLSIPVVPIDQSYSMEVQVEDDLTAPFVVFQTAVMHTTCFGERRLRVITLALPVTNNLVNLYASVDQTAIATLFACRAVDITTRSSLSDGRDHVTKSLVDILAAFKTATQVGGGGASTQLASPKNMRFLALLCLGLIRHVGLRESSQIPPDMRSYAQALLTTLPSQLLVPYLHPRFYALHTMPDDAGTIGEHGVILPEPMNLTSERLERHGLFIIEDGQNIFLWIGREAVPQLVQDVFDIPSYAELPGGKTTLPTLDNSFSQRVNAIINKTREMRRSPYRAHVYVVKEDGEPALRQWALSGLVEDRFDRTPSYSQYISTLRDKVNSISS
ncbi:Sec23/Sec24 trunk domain-containing protein [Mrakia frigida]|uniref:Sec23/Sec24 trunk domain-containing protein n=1 Tax=Mrakia frigida TaxID=29902 RepID=UPI003FCC0A47